MVSLNQFSRPVAVTVITEQDILVSSSRNMMDLMETYVPGFFWMDHPSEGAKAGMRGIISDRNLKLLLLVNGVVLNERGHRGVVAEISNWDLGDIEKIEVIRGPGSVTYGPGAIEGVISITTKRATGNNKTGGSLNYMTQYNSRGANFYTGGTSESGVKSYFYGSVQSTEGITDPQLFKATTPTNFGMPDQLTPAKPTNPYMRDAKNIPQVKLMADFDFGKGYKFTTRYNQTGMYGHSFDQYQGLSSFDAKNKPVYKGDFVPSIYNRHQEIVAVGEKSFKLSERFDLKTMLIYDNENSFNSRYQTSTAVTNNLKDSLAVRDFQTISDVSSLRHVYFQFSEEQITGKAIGSYNSENKKFSGALGVDLAHNTWRAPWFGKSQDIRMGDQRNILSDSTVDAVANSGTKATAGQIAAKDGVYIGNGWSTNTISVYGEAKYAISDKFSVLVSGRADKDTYSPLLISPRAAFIAELNKHNFRLAVLESNRMNTAAQMLQEHRLGKKSDPEKLQAIELLYSYVHSSKLQADVNVYYNTVDVLSWNGTAQQKTGKGKYTGTELSVSYKDEKFQVGASHSVVFLLDWKLADSSFRSGVSYSDYNQTIITKGDTTTMKSVGKHLNNYTENISKLFVNYHLLKNKLTLHVDTRILWGFQGADDGLTSYQNAYSSDTSVTKFVNAARSNNIYKTDMRVNASISYKFTKNITGVLFVNNLFYTNNAKRYYYDSGMSSYNPTKTMYIQEPRFYGMRLLCNF